MVFGISNADISHNFNLPKELAERMDDLFRKDGNCLTFSEFCRYAIRLFNEFISNHTTLKVGQNSAEAEWVRERQLKLSGKALLDFYHESYGEYEWGDWTMGEQKHITVKLTENMVTDINSYRVLYHIYSVSDYIGIAFAWIVDYYRLMGEGYEHPEELIGQSALKQHFVKLTGGEENDRVEGLVQDVRWRNILS